MALLVVHLAAVGYLTGLVWVVQLVVYPGFRTVGDGPSWSAFHAAHTRAIGPAVGLPWAVQGATLAVLLVHRPAGVPLWLVLVAAALGLATVVVTLVWSVPLHGRLAAYERSARTLDGVDRLIATNWLRTAAWSGGLVAAGAMVLCAS